MFEPLYKYQVLKKIKMNAFTIKPQSVIGQYISRVKRAGEAERKEAAKAFEEMTKIYGPEVIEHAEKFTEINGIGLFSLAGLMNHSCGKHNVQCLFVSDHEMFVFASRPISKGEQLFHSYLDPSLRFSRKRSFLRIKYDFLCPDCSS